MSWLVPRQENTVRVDKGTPAALCCAEVDWLPLADSDSPDPWQEECK